VLLIWSIYSQTCVYRALRGRLISILIDRCYHNADQKYYRNLQQEQYLWSALGPESVTCLHVYDCLSTTLQISTALCIWQIHASFIRGEYPYIRMATDEPKRVSNDQNLIVNILKFAALRARDTTRLLLHDSACSTCSANQRPHSREFYLSNFWRRSAYCVYLWRIYSRAQCVIEPVYLRLLNIFANSLNRIEKPSNLLSHQDQSFFNLIF